MKISMLSNIEKVRAPSGIEFHKGLGCETLLSSRLLGGQPSGLCEVHRADGEPDCDAEWSERADGESRLEGVGDGRHEGDLPQREAKHLHLPELGKTQANQHEAHHGQQRSGDFHEFQHCMPPQGTVFSVALLRQRLSVSYDSDNLLRIAYYELYVKPKTKIAISGVSQFLIRMIKKFSSPKMRNREFVFTPKIEYKLVAERSEANLSNLQFPT